MKFFIYKSLFVCLLIFIMFHLTFGYTIKSYENQLMNNFSEDKIQFVAKKIREELKDINQKDKILYPEDAELLGTFLKKILSEINKTN
jgi:hypothetical protein